MTTPHPPTDPHNTTRHQCVGSASTSASTRPPGQTRAECVGSAPSPTEPTHSASPHIDASPVRRTARPDTISATADRSPSASRVGVDVEVLVEHHAAGRAGVLVGTLETRRGGGGGRLAAQSPSLGVLLERRPELAGVGIAARHELVVGAA